MHMKSKEMSDAEYDRLFAAYEGLVEWIGDNEVDGQETLGLLIKAATALAVLNKLPLDQVLEVVSVTYKIEKATRPSPDEVH